MRSPSSWSAGRGKASLGKLHTVTKAVMAFSMEASSEKGMWKSHSGCPTWWQTMRVLSPSGCTLKV